MDRSTQFSPGSAQQREQQAIERILDDESLRKTLTDAQAQRLNDWAFGHIASVVGRTQHLPDDDAQPVIDAALAAITAVMQCVNQIPHHIAKMGEAEANKTFEALLTNLEVLQEVAEHAPAQLNALFINRERMDPAIIFEWLMLIIEINVK